MRVKQKLCVIIGLIGVMSLYTSCRARSSFSLLVLAIFLVFVIMCYWQYQSIRIVDSFSRNVSSESSLVYGIMFDAGSTGSRIHIFKFVQSVSGDIHRVVDQKYIAISPGLSSYANEPQKGSESLQPLLNAALKLVPVKSWNSTLIALKATAGLRLLTNSSALRLLNEVKRLFKSYPFKLLDDSITIMKGSDEGVFCWFTVNYLHDLWHDSKDTVGMIDLGGGSAQFTFVPQTKVAKEAEKHLVKVQYAGVSYNLYSRSYLGLGINSARFQVLGGNESTGKFFSVILTVLGDNESTELDRGKSLRSVCLPSNYSGSWKHAGHVHNVSNVHSPRTQRYRACCDVIRKVIASAKMDPVVHSSNVTLFALSYFIEHAVSTKMIDSAADGGVVTVADFSKVAKRACYVVGGADPFRCMDSCYLSVLLLDGFRLSPSSTIQLKRRTTNDLQLAWPLGAMLNVYGKLIKERT